jgi:hypothetical protein
MGEGEFLTFILGHNSEEAYGLSPTCITSVNIQNPPPVVVSKLTGIGSTCLGETMIRAWVAVDEDSTTNMSKARQRSATSPRRR